MEYHRPFTFNPVKPESTKERKNGGGNEIDTCDSSA